MKNDLPKENLDTRPAMTPFVATTAMQERLEFTLQLKRPHGSVTEMLYVKWLCEQIEAAGYGYDFDAHGNVWVIADAKSPVLFTAHTDTVHHTDGKQAIGQYVTANGHVMLMTSGAPDVLGADDGTGCVILLELLSRGVAGTYVWFRGEEVGCLGSKAFAKMDIAAYYLDGIKYAVAFDRAGYSDVVSVQRGSACCSDEFAYELSVALSKAGEANDLLFAPARGVYTDTAELTKLIKECTNISVGYFYQHTNQEYQDVTFLEQLIEALCVIDWEALPSIGVPQKSIESQSSRLYTYNSYKSYKYELLK